MATGSSGNAVLEAFRDAMAEYGIITSAELEADGRLHRIHVEGDKRGTRNGWYKLHADPPPAGAFGHWRTGVSETWCAAGTNGAGTGDRSGWRERVAARRREQAAEIEDRRAKARRRAARLWAKAAPADPAHVYLTRKQVGPHGIRELGEVLLVPVRGAGGELRGLQRIRGDGAKLFTAGTEVAGGYYAIGRPDDRVIVAEGFATAATIHEATGDAVACAFNAGNLERVAAVLREKLGAGIRILIAADNDAGTTGNPGVTAATEAARAAGGLIAVPTFDEGETGTDFNDLAAIRGPDAVRVAIAAARPPRPIINEDEVRAEVERLRVRREARRRLEEEDCDVPEATSWTLAELLADPDAVNLPAPVVPMLAWPGRATLFAATEKLGKSTLAGAASAAVSAGRRWLAQETVRGPVVWAAEESPGDVARRLHRFGADPELLTIMTWGRDPIAEIRAEVERVRPVLTVVDTLQAIAEHARPESGSGSQWAAIMRPLVRISRATGTALLILHHARRSDGAYRDSGEIAAAVDVIIEMTGRDTDTLRRLAWRGRYGRGNYAVRLAGGRYELLDREDDGEALADEVIRYIAGHPGTGSSAICERIGGRDSDIRRVLADLVAAGRVVDDGTGHRHRYRVPETRPETRPGSSEADATRPVRPARPIARPGAYAQDCLGAPVTRPGPTHRVGRVPERAGAGPDDEDRAPLPGGEGTL